MWAAALFIGEGARASDAKNQGNSRDFQLHDNTEEL